jgi:hypothetical protein
MLDEISKAGNSNSLSGYNLCLLYYMIFICLIYFILTLQGRTCPYGNGFYILFRENVAYGLTVKEVINLLERPIESGEDSEWEEEPTDNFNFPSRA